MHLTRTHCVLILTTKLLLDTCGDLASVQAIVDYLFISHIFFSNYIVLPQREIVYLFIYQGGK